MLDTLVNDIYKVLEEGQEGYAFERFGERSQSILQSRTDPDSGPHSSRVRFSNVGSPCVRQLWYKLHKADEAEPLLPHNRLKFLYGELIEEMLLELVRASGHSVDFEQAVVEKEGVEGHIDCVIDGVLVDVKSASPFSFKKFEGGLRSEDDAFGYLGQLGGYLTAIQDDERFSQVAKDRAAFLAVNKVSGEICLDVHTFDEQKLKEIAETNGRNKVSAEGETTPERAFEDVAEGKSGNRKLDVNCSYCQFKNQCWPELRTFLYSRGPVFLTKVEREPDVFEVKND